MLQAGFLVKMAFTPFYQFLINFCLVSSQIKLWFKKFKKKNYNLSLSIYFIILLQLEEKAGNYACGHQKMCNIQ